MFFALLNAENFNFSIIKPAHIKIQLFFNESAHKRKDRKIDNENQTSALPVQYGEISLGSSDVTSSDVKDFYKAIDKDLSTVVSAGTTSTDNDIWIRFDLSETHLIDKVVIYLNFFTGFYNNKNTGCMADETAFKNCKKTQEGLEVSVLQEGDKQKSCGTIELSLGLKQSDQIYTFDCAGTKGNAVMLTKTPVHSNTFLPLWEVVIFRVVPGKYNIH